MTRRFIFTIAFGARIAAAQAPPPAPASDDKVDAKALNQSGVKLLEAKDYLGALAVFVGAYARFPSAKILLNIGTTQKLLDRNADAANSYQRYLDSPDADTAHVAEVTSVVAELDKVVGRLAITVTPDDAQVELADGWIPAKTVRVWRVSPGAFTVKARRDGYQPETKTATIAAGEQLEVGLHLVEIPAPVVVKPTITTPSIGEDRVIRTAPPEGPRSRIGGLAVVHVSVAPKLGSAVLVGATADITEQLAVDAALILGPGLVTSGMATVPPPSYGAYVGASYAFLTGALRPRASGGFPVFASSGARFSVRAAGGIEYVANRHVAVMFDLGLEYELNPETDIRHVALVPSLAASGRL